jgi:hypothetical protein
MSIPKVLTTAITGFVHLPKVTAEVSMNWHVSRNFSRQSGDHSVSGGMVRMASSSFSRFSSSVS